MQCSSRILKERGARSAPLSPLFCSGSRQLDGRFVVVGWLELWLRFFYLGLRCGFFCRYLSNWLIVVCGLAGGGRAGAHVALEFGSGIVRALSGAVIGLLADIFVASPVNENGRSGYIVLFGIFVERHLFAIEGQIALLVVPRSMPTKYFIVEPSLELQFRFLGRLLRP